MKLRYAARSPFVRKVMVVAHEHELVDRIEILPTTLSPIAGNPELARENPLMKVPSLVTDDGQALFEFAGDLRVSRRDRQRPQTVSDRPCGAVAGFASAGARRRHARCDHSMRVRELSAAGEQTLERVDRRADAKGSSGPRRRRRRGFIERADNWPDRNRFYARLSRSALPRRRLAPPPSAAGGVVRGVFAAPVDARDQTAEHMTATAVVRNCVPFLVAGFDPATMDAAARSLSVRISRARGAD